MQTTHHPSKETAVLAGGCFWCLEAVFESLKGVTRVRVGYAGGAKEDASYHRVAGGKTGHAEAVEIVFEPEEISYRKLLEVFFQSHDPTTKNRQGADIGPQYRSVIFYTTPEQERQAKEVMAEVAEALASDSSESSVTTELKALEAFYPAEDEHQDFYSKNKTAPYCQVVINPKLEKIQKIFKADIKK